MKLPTVFLSLSGQDRAFVTRVQEFLPDGLANFYPRSFTNGENLISAMEERVQESTIFALFASKQSLASHWVQFEIGRARIAKILNPKLRLLTIVIDPDLNYDQLPEWMREFWVGKIGHGPREIARYIRRALIAGSFSDLPGARIYGRGTLIDKAQAQIAEAILRTEQSPNVFVLGGNRGIGRRTFAQKLLAEAFPAEPQLGYGPRFFLPQFADLADIYRVLRQEIETGLTHESMRDDVQVFAQAPIEEQAAEVERRLAHFAELGQAATVISGNGIFEDRGYLKAWVPELFRRLMTKQKIKLVIVSNRLLHEKELRAHPNVLQLQIPPLTETDIRTLMIESISALGTKPVLPSPEVVRTIGGHPGIARATAALVARMGPTVINNDPSDLFALQEEVLEESLNFERLSEVDKDILSILSWVPQLSGDLLKKVILSRYATLKPEEFASVVAELILACVIEVAGANYQISSPVRTLFRRRHGYGAAELRVEFSKVLREAWRLAEAQQDLRAELLDAIAYMSAIEGGTLPPEFKSLLLPSTLQEVVRDTYDQNHDDPEALGRVVAWGLPAKKMGMDETTREEILSYVIRAQTRLRDAEGATELLSFFDQRGYRSRFYLRAFFAKLYHSDYKQAVGLLLKARETRKYMGRVIGELAACYQHLGMWRELKELVKEEERHIGRNPVLMNVRIGMLIAQNDFQTAEREIRALRVLPRQEAIADARSAAIMMRRDHNYDGARNLLTETLQRSKGIQLMVRRLRAIAAALSGDFDTARKDAEFLKARNPGFKVYDIEARIKLAQRNFDGALDELPKAGFASFQDELLRARILDAKAGSAATPFSERESLKQEAARIRARHSMVDEFEIDSLR